MRILLFTSSYAPRRGGLELVTGRLAEGLHARGHEVSVVTNRYPRSLKPVERIDGILVHRQLYPQVLPALEPRPLGKVLKGLLLLPLAPVALLRLALLVRRTHPDVVNVHYFSNPAIYMLLVAWLARIPTVLSFHGSDLSSIPFALGNRRALSWASRIPDAFTACSDDLKRVFEQAIALRRGGVPIVAHNGVDIVDQATDSILPSIPEPYMLVVGRLVATKGIDIAIRSVADLVSQGIYVSLMIVGDGPLRLDLESLTRECGITSQVDFCGHVDSGDMFALMMRSVCAVVPSRAEGFGIVCLEAMIASKAVIASRVGGIPEIVVDGETGLLVAPADVEALSRAMRTILDAPAKAEEMGRRGRERALACFSWDRMIDAYSRAYEQALATARLVPATRET